MSLQVHQDPNTDGDAARRELLKRTICKGASDDELDLFSRVCKHTGLDPFMKQIYPVHRWDAREKRQVMTIQTSIDGLRLIAERTGNYSPGKEPRFEYDKDGTLISATSYIKKRTDDGTWHEIASTAFFCEYAQYTKEGKLTQFWERMKHVMLAKCSEAMALRRSFPADMARLYINEEMMQAAPSKGPAEPAAIEAEIHEDTEKLTEAQCAELDSYTREDKEGEEKTIKHLKVQSIYDIRAQDFARVIGYLKKRRGEGTAC